ncbi:MAG: hypothetical protein GDA38_04715 [Hormoscilla sp. SP12CHS1]|nr:hypothetical protein [Hormoscilla sp. SP12CHS1]
MGACPVASGVPKPGNSTKVVFPPLDRKSACRLDLMLPVLGLVKGKTATQLKIDRGSSISLLLALVPGDIRHTGDIAANSGGQTGYEQTALLTSDL